MRWMVVAMLLVGSAWPSAAAAGQSVETRSFEGQGSRGVGSDVEFFLVEDTYRHTLEGTSDCIITASVFPGPRLPAAVLSDVIDADLAISGSVAADSFPITEQGWVNLQVGTGPDCSWVYTVTGAFLPPGDEPQPPGPRRIGWWPLALVAVTAVLLIGRGIARRQKEPPEEPKVRVADPFD